MKLTTKSLMVGLVLVGMSIGCAATAPQQLTQARQSYATSSSGLAARLSPTELYEAKKALDRAEREFKANGDTLELRDYAYIAERKIALADAAARTEGYRLEIAEAERQGALVRDDQVARAQVALDSTREQLRDERTAAGAQGRELQMTAAQLEAEKAARTTAEARLAGAMKDLSTIASVKDEARGVVITLSGSVLFASNRHELLETAKVRLDQVAEALKAQGDDRKIIVEGYTDSQGSDAINQPLSLNRANAVREYLVSRGVKPENISAVGMGSSRPLVNNSTAENRANNRRVEIVIAKPSRITMR